MADPIVYVEAQAILQVQEDISEGRFSLAWSYMLNIEVFRNPFLQMRNEILVWGDIASYLVKHKTPEIEAFSLTLQSKGVKPYDAAHVACAVDLYCDYFLTTDHKLLNTAIPEIEVVNPLDFIKVFPRKDEGD